MIYKNWKVYSGYRDDKSNPIYESDTIMIEDKKYIVEGIEVLIKIMHAKQTGQSLEVVKES